MSTTKRDSRLDPESIAGPVVAVDEAAAIDELPDTAAPTLPALGLDVADAAGGHRVVLLLALPVLFEQILNATVGYIDIFLAGRISKEATSAVGFASYIGWLMTGLSWLVCTGATALVSRHVGARDQAGANRFANQSLALSMGFGALGAAFLYAMAPTFVALQGLHGEAERIAVQYLRIDAFGYLLYGAMLGGAASLRGAGDMKAPMLLMGAVNVVNAIVSTALVYGLWGMPNIGTPGIAVGTLVGRLTGGLLMLALLAHGRSGLRLRRELLVPRWADLRRLLRVGVPAGVDAIIHWTGHFVFLMLVGRIGSGAVQTASYAAHMVGVRIEALSFLPAQAWGAAAATLVGQSLGAGRPAVAMRSGLQAASHIALSTAVMGVIYFTFAPQLFGFFSADPLVAEVGVAPLRLLAFVQPALGILIVFLHALRGAGDTRRPVLFTIIGTWGVRLPVAAILIYGFGFGLLGAWIGMAADIVVRAALMSGRFLRGRWKYVVV